MKRSEALKVVLKELEKNFEKSKTVCPTSGEFAGIAHDILFRLESAGMLPPLIQVGHSYETDYGTEWDASEENEWEKEVQISNGSELK